jgi:hypothetical protein
MGFHLAGFAINRNYKDNMDELAKALFISGRVKLVQGKNKFKFDKASTAGSTKGRMDFYYTETGSFAFVNLVEFNYVLGKPNPKLLQGVELVAFAVEETGMTFGLKYYRDGLLIREYMEHDGRCIISKGEVLTLEQEETDKTNLFFQLAKQVSGVDFWALTDEEFVRFLKK